MMYYTSPLASDLQFHKSPHSRRKQGHAIQGNVISFRSVYVGNILRVHTQEVTVLYSFKNELGNFRHFELMPQCSLAERSHVVMNLPALRKLSI
jgi:hypothetical protein